MCCGCGLHLLPLGLVLISLSTFCVTYIVAVVRDDVYPFFPYISDTGTTPFESCLFSFFLNLSCILALATMYVRYRYIRIVSQEERALRCSNVLGLLFGWLSALGLGIVANFQETSLESVHMTGAAMAIGSGIIYIFLQTRLSYKMNELLCWSRIRLVMGMLCTLTATLFLIFTLIAKSEKSSSTDSLHWKKDENGYTSHVTAAICEWLTCIIFILFFATYIQDFKRTSASVTFHVNSYEEEEGLKV